jgi:hypothetical protein
VYTTELAPEFVGVYIDPVTLTPEKTPPGGEPVSITVLLPRQKVFCGIERLTLGEGKTVMVWDDEI